MASIDSIDWLKWLRVNALDQPDLLLDRFPNAWLLNECGKDGSMNLYVSKREKALLEGHSDSMGPMGTVHMGLDRAYGM